jgi:hypothetical protein
MLYALLWGALLVAVILLIARIATRGLAWAEGNYAGPVEKALQPCYVELDRQLDGGYSVRITLSLKRRGYALKVVCSPPTNPPGAVLPRPREPVKPDRRLAEGVYER